MTIVSHVPRDDVKHHAGKPKASDDMSDVTPPTRGNGSANDQGKVSKVLKFRFQATTVKRDKTVAPILIHTHWIDAIQKTFGSDVDIINNKNHKLSRIDLLQWSNNPLMHQKNFVTYQKTTGRDDNRRTSTYILHRIQTHESIQNIKAAPKIQKILKDHNCYLTEHQWDETEWDTVTIGFVTNIDPSFYNPIQAHTKFLNTMHQKKSEINETRLKIKIPTFKMVFSSPTTYSTNNIRTSTKAYSIEVKHSQQIQMMQVLKSLFSNNLSVFVPYTMRYKYPEGFVKAIKYQTWQITNNSTIVLQNISESAMYYLETHIKATKGIKEVLPAKDVEYTGRYNILAEKNEFIPIRDHLMKFIKVWYDNHVPSDAMPQEGKFTGPPRVKPIIRDSESSGENSWMSRSSASFMSMDLSMVQNDNYFSTTQGAFQAYTYASVVHENPTSINAERKGNSDDDNREVISDITGIRSDNASHKYRLEIEQLLEKQNQERMAAEAIMSAQKAEIQRLTDAYQRANIAYEEVTSELRRQREQVNAMINERLSIADKKRNDDMKAMRHEMMMAMKDMLQNTQHNTTGTRNNNSSELKRPQQYYDTAVNNDDEDDDDSIKRQEKRVDRRKTPTKKLILEEE